MAHELKSNEELPMDADEINQLNQLVMPPLVQHPTYQAAVLPKRVAVPFYARYTAGMAYGEHTDDPVMGEGERYRSDVAITLFLNDPSEYEGGELSINTSFGMRNIKLPAGYAVLYPASSRHAVQEVTHGQRLVAVTWAQSLVPDPGRRELLYELHLARESLLTDDAKSETTRRVNHVYVNLVRQWTQV